MMRSFSASVVLLLVLTATGVGSACAAAASAPIPAKDWKLLSSPAAAGWSAEKLQAAQRFADSIGSSSVMIVQGGEVVGQWGDVAKKINTYSVRKSLLSALYGIYVAEGAIDPNQTLGQLGIADFKTRLNAAEQQTRIVDLLRARSGIYLPVDYENQQQVDNRPARGSHPPGTYWFYNNWDFNAVGTILEHAAGMPVGEAFYRRIALPLGMQDFKPEDVLYIGGPISPHRAYLFNVTARDMARFGLLYLRQGRWGDRQVVPAVWVEKSSHTTEMVKNGGADAGGYEYLWWVEHQGVHFPGVQVPHGTFSARGAGGHYIVIIPAYDLVIVHRVDNNPKALDIASINAAGYTGIKATDFGQLLRLILEARPHS